MRIRQGVSHTGPTTEKLIGEWETGERAGVVEAWWEKFQGHLVDRRRTAGLEGFVRNAVAWRSDQVAEGRDRGRNHDRIGDVKVHKYCQ